LNLAITQDIYYNANITGQAVTTNVAITDNSPTLMKKIFSLFQNQSKFARLLYYVYK